MIARAPNSEQSLAIAKKGNVLLSAGAGSGKTFVIIEHIIFLLKKHQELYSEEELNKNIANFLSGIVLMTFTTKAAGEMSIRLTRKIEEQCQISESQEKKYWELIHKNLPFIKIVTIHGLCHNLLRSGFWPEFPIEIKLLNKLEHKNKIKVLYDQWYTSNVDVLKPQFLAHTHELFKAIEEIFQSPELRILWEKPSPILNIQLELDEFFREWEKLRKFKFLFTEQFSFSDSPKKTIKKAYQIIEQFSALSAQSGKINFKNYKEYITFFQELSRFPTALKEMSEEEKMYLAEMRQLQTDIAEWGEDFFELENNFLAFTEWASILSDIFSYINLHYLKQDGFSFSDLEYYVLKGLEDTFALKKIQESLSYFIVDEFQDTSFVQFEILQKLSGFNFSKIYAVGDRKQAIYGFRGGELQVFQECEKLVGVDGNLALEFNYRSKMNIINFNNAFFNKIFPLGIKYNGIDTQQTEMAYQKAIESLDSPGTVNALRFDVKGIIDHENLDLCEARVLANEIESLIRGGEFKSICILYRKLQPSYYLIDILKDKGLGFKAQIKISFLEDPLIAFFKSLLENILNAKDENRKISSYLFLSSLGKLLGITQLSNDLIEEFVANSKILGIKNAFIKLLLSLGVTNSYCEQNLNLPFSICDLGEDNFLTIYHILKDNDEEYSSELNSGSQKKRIILMTAHASKGLEFDAVLLGGVHTNGGYMGMREKVGKMPKSFRWKKSFDQKDFYKSPTYFLEAEILKQKNFSEGKRLLYVACTRAISYLGWVDLRNEDKDLINDQNSWINALRLSGVATREVSIQNLETRSYPPISFLQKDSLGFLIDKNPMYMGIISELSVTRLASLADCPFKFYLKNICKINLDEKFYDASEEELVTAPTFYSSKERGTSIHLVLSKLFKNEPVEIPEDLQDMINWVKELALQLSGFRAVSEEMIKFSFFNVMISGTPDIFFLDETKKLVVWDFKTGTREDSKEASYWFQLMTYAYGLGKIYRLEDTFEMELGLLYVDEKIVTTKKLRLSEISQQLFLIWKKTESLSQVNLQHCSQCEYSSICKKSQA